MINSDLRVSIAIVTYRRFHLLADCLECIKNQTLPQNQYEIIVVDNSLQPEKSKAFRDSLERFSNLDYVITKKCGIAYARNVAMERCRAPILLFTDDDVRVPRIWCEEYIKLFNEYPAAGVIGGRVDPIWPQKPPAWLSGSLLDPLAIVNWDVKGVSFVTEGMWLVTANAGYRVKALKAGKGFCERLGRKGNLPFWHAELGANLSIKSNGYDLLYAPHIKAGHMIEPQRMEKEWFFRQQIFGGASMVAVKWQKEEDIDFGVLTNNLEDSYSRLLQTESASDNVDDVVRVTNIFMDEGYRVCLNHLGLKAEKTTQPRNIFWSVIYIVTPCLNAADTIDQTITSVLNQEGDFSIRYHIQDGGSTDGTLEKLDQWQQRLDEGSFPLFCKHVVFTYKSESDHSMYDAIGKGFATMLVPPEAFMTWINADDFFLPFAFDHVANIGRSFSEKVFWLGGNVALLNENRKLWQMPKRVLPNDIIKNGLCDGQHWDFVQQEGTFFRGSLWTVAKEEGVFDSLKLAGDWNLWRILAQHTQYYQLSWPLGAFRLHGGQLSQECLEEYQSEIDATISPTKRREAFKELTSQENLWAYVVKEDPRLGGLVAIREDGTTSVAHYRQRLNGSVVNPQVQPSVFQTPGKDDSVQSPSPQPDAVSAVAAGGKKTEKQPQQISKTQLRRLVTPLLPDPTKIVFGPGWHDPEGDEDNWWGWSSQAGIIHLKTDRGGRSKIFFSALSQNQDNVIRLNLNGHVVAKISANRDESSVSPIKVRLKRGTNVLELVSDMDSVVSQRDPRPLNFMVKNLDFIPAKGQGAKSSLTTTIRKIEQSGLFFSSYYKKQVPELPQQQSPIEHYCLYGAWEGKNPNHFFDTAFYLDQNHKVYITGKNPLLHYLEIGWQQGRDPHPEFSTNRYLNTYSEVKKSGVNPLVHYLKYGVLEDRNPSPPPKIPPEHFQDFTFSRRSHWKLFSGYDEELYGKLIDMDECTLKSYQDLLVFTFIGEHVPAGSRLLDIGGGYSRILKYFAKEYDCWNVDKMEGMGDGPKKINSVPYKLVRDYIGNFNRDLPDEFFDFVFSISALEHTPEDDTDLFDKIIQDIQRVLKPGGHSLHLFDVRFLPDGAFWTNKLVHRMFELVDTLNKWIQPETIINDQDLYVMSEQAYNQNWLPITKQEYVTFGRPASLNILWRKPL